MRGSKGSAVWIKGNKPKAEKKSSAITAIIAITWKPLSSDRRDRSDNGRCIEKVLSQRSLLLRSPRSLESGFHMITTIAAMAELFFFSVIAAIKAIVAIIWKQGLRKCKVTFITNALFRANTWYNKNKKFYLHDYNKLLQYCNSYLNYWFL